MNLSSVPHRRALHDMIADARDRLPCDARLAAPR
jgi:hypothetical protein